MKVKKKITLGVIALIVTIFGYLFFKEKETVFYIGMSNPSESIDLSVKIDDIQIFNDTVEYNPYKCIIIKKRLRGGFRKVNVQSNKVRLKKELKTLLLKQHVIIEYFPASNEIEEAEFSIRNSITPFYLE